MNISNKIIGVILEYKILIFSWIITLISWVGVGVYIYFNKCEECICETDCIQKIEKVDIESTSESTITFDIKGSIKNPGVYTLPSGSNVNDALVAAGGLTKYGTTKNINLSKKITDQMVIYVFSSSELNKQESSNQIICEIPKCSCETIEVDTPLIEDKTNATNNLININTAKIDELTKLDGVGEARAKTIIEYREKTPFKAIEDIMNISGIGEAAFAKIKDKICV